jgi:hypothetical protein
MQMSSAGWSGALQVLYEGIGHTALYRAHLRLLTIVSPASPGTVE